MAKNIKRLLAMSLVVCMLISVLPMQALAAEGDGTTYETSPEGLTTTVTQTTTGEGTPTITVTITKDTPASGTENTYTDSNGNEVTLNRHEEKVTETTTNADGSTKEVVINSGEETKSWTEDVEYDENGKHKEEFSLDTGDVTTTVTNKGDGSFTFGGSATSTTNSNVDKTDDNNYTVTETTDKITVSGTVTITGESHTVNIAYKKDENGNIVYKQQKDTEGNPVTDADGNPVYEMDENGEPIPEIDDEALYCPVGSEDYEGKGYGPSVSYKTDHNNVVCSCCGIATDGHDCDGIWAPDMDALAGYTQPKPDTEGLNEGFDMVWIGTGEGTQEAVAVFVKYVYQYEDVLDENSNPVYEKDDNGNIKTDADGNPVVKQQVKKDIDGNPLPVMEPVKDQNGNIIYEKDANGNLKLDENNEPIPVMQPKIEYFRDTYGKDHYSGMVTQTNQFVLKHENGNFFYAYCMDASTGQQPEINVWYHVSNIENHIYNAETNPNGYLSTDDAKHIKLIATYGYWGTDGNAYDENGNVIYQKDENGDIIYKKDNDGNIVYEVGADGKVKKDENGDPIPAKAIVTDSSVRGSVASLVQMLKNSYPEGSEIIINYPTKNGAVVTSHTVTAALFDGLTEAEAMAVTQAAIWTYSNNNDVDYYTNQGVLIEGGLSVYGVLSALKMHNSGSWVKEFIPEKDTNSDIRLQALYEVLLGLADLDETALKSVAGHIELPKNNESTVIPNEGVVTSAALVIKDKVEGNEANADTNVDNDVYNTELNFTLAFVPDPETDDMMVYLYVDGKDEPMAYRLAGAGENNDVVYNTDGSFTLKGLQLSENSDHTFDLQIHGTQYLNEGVYVYQAKGGREVSQTLVGLAAGKQDVVSTTQMVINFSVDEERNVVAQRVWYDEYDPDAKPEEVPGEPGDPGEPAEIQLHWIAPVNNRLANDGVEIPDEPVPLAAPVVTGDSTGMWIAFFLMIAFGMVAINIFDKKRQHETF